MTDPARADDVGTPIARAILRTVLPSTLVAVTICAGLVLLSGAEHRTRLAGLVIGLALFLAVWWLTHTGRTRLAVHVLVAGACTAILVAMVLNGGVLAPAYPCTMAVLALVAWLHGGRAALLFWLAATVIGGIFLWLGLRGWLPVVPPPPLVLVWGSITLFLFLTLCATAIPSRMLHVAIGEAEDRRAEAEEAQGALVQREQALLDREEQLRALIEASQDWIWSTDSAGNHTYCSPAVESILGYSPEELVGRSALELICEEDRERVREKFTAWSREGRGWRNELIRWQHRDGSIRHLESSAVPILAEDGQLLGYRGVDRDVTERLQAEQALRESESRFRTLVANIPGVNYRCANDEHWTMEFIGEEVENLTGYPAADFLGNRVRDFASIIYPDDRELVERAVHLGLERREPFTIEYRIVTVDDQVRWVYEKGQGIFDARGEVRFLDGVIVDITERRRAEEEREVLQTQLAQAQKMESIGTLAGGIAHDFNNILGAILGFTDLALMDVEGGRLRNWLTNIQQAGNRARDLVAQILAFSRQTRQTLAPVKPSTIAGEALKLLRASLPATIEIQADLGTDAEVVMDSTQLHQVLLNLCTNSAHAMAEVGGILTVSLREQELGEDFTGRHEGMAPGRHVELCVSDTGHGIPPELQERVFDPFFTTKGKGTGMGLAVVHGIVRSAQGAVTVESHPGEGAEFRVYLPVAGEHRETEQEERTTAIAGTERILFVDDEKIQCELAAEGLGRLGYQVTTRCDPQEALQLFQQDPDAFDVVVLDTTMPKLTGDLLAAAMLLVRPDLPVIITTGFSERMDEARARSLGIRAMLHKPALASRTAQTIRSILDQW